MFIQLGGLGATWAVMFLAKMGVTDQVQAGREGGSM